MDTSTFAIVHIQKNANRMRILVPHIEEMQHLKFGRRLEKYILATGDDFHYFEINVAHREWVVETLRYLYEGVVEYRDHSTHGRCDTRCENANVYVEELEKLEEEYRETICVCACKGEFHGGGGDWKYVIGTVLISEKITQVTRYYPSLDWRLWATELPHNHPVRPLLKPLLPAQEDAA